MVVQVLYFSLANHVKKNFLTMPIIYQLVVVLMLLLVVVVLVTVIYLTDVIGVAVVIVVMYYSSVLAKMHVFFPFVQCNVWGLC